MNKTALMNYALSARKELESQIALSLNKLGIYEDSIKRADIVGDYTIIEGTEETFPKRVYELRNTIISDHIQPDGFKNVVEEFAYTWFNRIIALRFMEVHDYFDHGFRVLTSRDGSYEPEIFKNVMYVIDDLKLNKAVVESLSTQGKTEELYRYILFNQCNKLSGVLPMLFSMQEAYMELLLPNNLLSAESVIRKIQEIPEEDFKNDVEVIGWLYQFYNSVKKDEVFASKETITKDTLPAVTQLFTPDWIVRYMAQNSVGRIWIESHPDSPLKEKMKYYVDDAKQTTEVQEKLDAIKYKNVNLETLKIIEPCCGSGHILVYVFDLLFEMYKENGYAIKDIPATILKNNLYGLDIDRRAAQLSQFALMMKARSIDNRFFSETRIVIPQVYEIQDSKLLISLNYQEMIKEFGFSSSASSTIQYLVDTFRDGKVIGSLLKVEKKDYQEVANEIATIRSEYTPNLFQNKFFYAGLNRIEELCSLAEVLSSKYDVMITNPPYCLISNLEKDEYWYFEKNYFAGKVDLCSLFMEVPYIKTNGYLSMINMQTWMFINSYRELRKYLLRTYTNMVFCHLGTRAFDSINGDVVSTAAFVFKKSQIDGNSLWIKLTNLESEMKASSFFDKKRWYFSDMSSFSKIPDFVFAYWLPKTLISAFEGPKISDFAVAKAGTVTGDDPFFLRQWFEIDKSKVDFHPIDYLEKPEYVPFQKGGSFCRFYGNNGYVLKFRDFYDQDKVNKSVRRGDEKYYFHKGIGWSQIGGASNKSFRLIENAVCGTATPTIYFDDETHLFSALAYLNTSLSSELLSSLNPTMNLLTTDVMKMPCSFFGQPEEKRLSDLAKSSVQICKDFEKSLETSWDFSNPLDSVMKTTSIESLWKSQSGQNTQWRESLRQNEKEINEIIDRIYSFQDNPDGQYLSTIPELSKQSFGQSVVSMLVGLILGRWQIEPNQRLYCDLKKIIPDDGMVPLYQFLGIDGGLSDRLFSMIRIIWGQDEYKDNLSFLSEALGRIGNESSEEAINRYLNKSFYSFHLRLYDKKPIYWLFQSGSRGAFACLLNVRYYSEKTLARINSKYFLPCTALYKNERLRCERKLLLPSENEREKKATQLKATFSAECESELFEYGQALEHVASNPILIDEEDGIKSNYSKFQGIEVVNDQKTLKINLLYPIK
jgi:hypothetical protein